MQVTTKVACPTNVLFDFGLDLQHSEVLGILSFNQFCINNQATQLAVLTPPDVARSVSQFIVCFQRTHCSKIRNPIPVYDCNMRTSAFRGICSVSAVRVRTGWRKLMYAQARCVVRPRAKELVIDRLSRTGA
jgi:hypothetical protein